MLPSSLYIASLVYVNIHQQPLHSHSLEDESTSASILDLEAFLPSVALSVEAELVQGVRTSFGEVLVKPEREETKSSVASKMERKGEKEEGKEDSQQFRPPTQRLEDGSQLRGFRKGERWVNRAGR